MRAVIVSGAPRTELDARDFLGEALFIIGADRGALTLLQHGVIPDLAVGDFDSVSESEYLKIKEKSRELLPLNPEKDETDTEIAVNYAIQQGAAEIFLYGGLGGRLDHTIANIRLLLRFAKLGVSIVLVEAGNRLRILSPGTHRFERFRHRYLSFFAMEQTVQGLTLQGLKYPLDGATLAQEDTVCISNEIVAENFDVAFSTGFLLMIESSDS